MSASDFSNSNYLVLRRWAKVLLEEGKESRQLTDAEEQQLFADAYRAVGNGDLTPRKLRDLAQMGDSRSARTMSSTLLGKWNSAKKIRRKKVGRYEFIEKPMGYFIDIADLEQLFKGLESDIVVSSARSIWLGPTHGTTAAK